MSFLRGVKVKLLYLEYLWLKFFSKVYDSKSINLLYYRIRNWGDLINPELISALEVKHVDIDIELKNKYLSGTKETFNLVIGSVLQHADSNTIIWGSGLIDSDIKLLESPKYISAVRGPLTRDVLINQGISCPEVYGDPALLLPYLFPDTTQKRFKLGLILHNDHSLNESVNSKLINDDDVLIISLRGGFREVLNKILSCENIISSSLHGLIVSEAYGIPTKRLKLKKDLYGGDFKFIDYYSSVKVEPDYGLPFDVSVDSKSVLIDCCYKKELDIDLALLVQNCPFLSDDKKEKLLALINAKN